jgi:hypothetical protein
MNGMLASWQTNFEALVAGEGATATIIAEQVLRAEGNLFTMNAKGSPVLAQAIAAERARLPPFTDFIGFDMNQFSDIVLGPAEDIFANGFEVP